MDEKQLEELLKRARLRKQVMEEKTVQNETEEFLLKHPNFKPGNTPISAEYIYAKYKQWRRGDPTDSRWFFRRFPKSYQRKLYEDGTYYLLDKRLLMLTAEEEKQYAKKAQRPKKKT
jgi:hypothetical protein